MGYIVQTCWHQFRPVTTIIDFHGTLPHRLINSWQSSLKLGNHYFVGGRLFISEFDCYIWMYNENWIMHVSYILWWQIKMIITKPSETWWRHQMEIFSALLAICAGNSPLSRSLWRHRNDLTQIHLSRIICTGMCLSSTVHRPTNYMSTEKLEEENNLSELR